MTKEDIIAQLDRLREDRDAWEYNATERCHTVRVDDYTISIHYQDGLHYWTVEHDRFGTLLEDAMANLISHARHAAIDFTRSHVLGHHVPQHAD